MTPNHNQNPEQIARDRIDQKLRLAGWVIQDKAKMDFGVATGIAVREYPTEAGPADYVLFVDRKPVGVIEAKKEGEGQNLTVVEDQLAATTTSGAPRQKKRTDPRNLFCPQGVYV